MKKPASRRKRVSSFKFRVSSRKIKVASCATETARCFDSRGEKPAALAQHDSAPNLPQLPPKARGEVAEAYFLAKAMSLGLAVLKPFGDSTKYDFVVDFDGRFMRVQVKSAWTATARNAHEYQFGASPARTDAAGTRPYRRNEIDFLVAYVVPEDVWYVIPVRVVVKRNHLTLNTRMDDRYARYREAWRLLRR